MRLWLRCLAAVKVTPFPEMDGRVARRHRTCVGACSMTPAYRVMGGGGWWKCDKGGGLKSLGTFSGGHMYLLPPPPMKEGGGTKSSNHHFSWKAM